MNEIVNKFLLVGNKFMLKMYLQQPALTYSDFEPFPKKAKKK